MSYCYKFNIHIVLYCIILYYYIVNKLKKEKKVLQVVEQKQNQYQVTALK